MGIVTEERVQIIVVEIAGTSFCVASCDGQKVHNRIAAALCENKEVELSFEGISELTPAFLNSAIGQLYGGFPAELIESSLLFMDISEEDGIILKRVIERAKAYFEHAYSCRKALRDVLGGEDA
ncbi:MAG TPA: STAS-like domain-containing protein [Methanosarcina sp.]|nr:STAS-like domain-containing protein [Methanosarcina sp.]